MKNTPLSKQVSTAVIAAFLLPLCVLAQIVTSELTVMGVTKKSNGEEALVTVNAVKPGDLLQYTAVYKNSSKQPAKQMVATLPIPAETEYVASSVVPGTALASLDGKVYEPIPLKRKVKQADGKLVTVPVPLAEYRFLRWPERDLAPGASYSTSARVRVISTAAAAPLPAGVVSATSAASATK